MSILVLMFAQEFGYKPIFPPLSASTEEFEAGINDSILGLNMRKQLPAEEVSIFFDKLHRHQALHDIEANSDEYKDDTIIQNFLISLQYPYSIHHSNFAINSLLGEEYIAYAFTAGYIFLDSKKGIEVFLASNKERKHRPYGDFHDYAAGQFEKEYDIDLKKMPQAQRCLFFHTWNKQTQQIEYFLVPVESLFSQSRMLMGERYNDRFLADFTDQQIFNFEKRYSKASYTTTQIVILDPSRKDAISELLSDDRLAQIVESRLQSRVETGMSTSQAIREALREMILGKAGVKDAFSHRWSTQKEAHWTIDE